MKELRGTDTLTSAEEFEAVGHTKGIIYVRVSTGGQVDKYSLDSQIDLCKDYAIETLGYTEDELIACVELGMSGDNVDRVAMNNALSLLEKGIGQTLIILHPDRLSRDSNLQAIISNRVWNAGCELSFVEIDLDRTNPESMLQFNIQGAISAYNKSKILANSKRGRIQKAKAGKLPAFRRMYGYTFDGDNLHINREEKEVLDMMVNMLLVEGKSCNRISKELSLKGITPPNGDIWYQTTVTRILRNESYKGIFYYGRSKIEVVNGKRRQVPNDRDKWIGIDIPQLIDEITFIRIQEAIDAQTKNKGRSSRQYLLKGLCICGRCGSACGSGTKTVTSLGTYLYYSCRVKYSKGYKDGEKAKKCEGRNWRVDMVDELVWDWLVSKLKNPQEIIQDIAADLEDTSRAESLSIEKAKLEEALLDLENERKNYIKLFGKGRISEDDLDEFLEPIENKLDFSRNELEIINKKIATVTSAGTGLAQMVSYLANFQKQVVEKELDMETKQKYVKTFIRKVIMNEDGTIEIFAVWGKDSSDTDSDNTQEVGLITTKPKQSLPIIHQILNHVQGDGFNFYVEYKLDLPETEYSGVYSYEKHIPELDKLVALNHDHLLTAHQIHAREGITVENIKLLFKSQGVELLKFSDISRKKREQDFDKLYKLHFNNKFSLNEIYEITGLSPLYVKRVFKEKGLKHLGFSNQLKEVGSR